MSILKKIFNIIGIFPFILLVGCGGGASVESSEQLNNMNRGVDETPFPDSGSVPTEPPNEQPVTLSIEAIFSQHDKNQDGQLIDNELRDVFEENNSSLALLLGSLSLNSAKTFQESELLNVNENNQLFFTELGHQLICIFSIMDLDGNGTLSIQNEMSDFLNGNRFFIDVLSPCSNVDLAVNAPPINSLPDIYQNTDLDDFLVFFTLSSLSELKNTISRVGSGLYRVLPTVDDTNEKQLATLFKINGYDAGFKDRYITDHRFPTEPGDDNNQDLITDGYLQFVGYLSPKFHQGFIDNASGILANSAGTGHRFSSIKVDVLIDYDSHTDSIHIDEKVNDLWASAGQYTQFSDEASEVGMTILAADFDLESYPSDDDIVRNLGSKVGYLVRGSHIIFTNFSFGLGASSFSLTASSGSVGGTLLVRMNSPFSAPIATIDVPNTGGWDTFQQFTTSIDDEVSGRINRLYLTFDVTDEFQTSSEYLFDIKDFRFDRNTELNLNE